MKKVICMLLLAMFSFGTAGVYAQTKKDGTKDMRYKANKVKLTKGGKPDMRYKENKEAKAKKKP